MYDTHDYLVWTFFLGIIFFLRSLYYKGEVIDFRLFRATGLAFAILFKVQFSSLWSGLAKMGEGSASLGECIAKASEQRNKKQKRTPAQCSRRSPERPHQHGM